MIIHVSQVTKFIDYFYKNNLNQEFKNIEDFIAKNKATNFKFNWELPIFEWNKYYLAKFNKNGTIIPTTDWRFIKNANLANQNRRLRWQ